MCQSPIFFHEMVSQVWPQRRQMQENSISYTLRSQSDRVMKGPHSAMGAGSAR